MKLLVMDTSCKTAMAAVCEEGNVLASIQIQDQKTHSVKLLPAVKYILAAAGVSSSELGLVAVTNGPGSYTGLRIGVTTAKAFAYSLGIPLIGLNTLETLAAACAAGEEQLVCPMIDARRMEVYTAFFDRNNQQVIDTKAEIVDENSFADLLAGHKIYFFGNGSDKVRMLLTAPNAHFMGQVETSARHMIPLAEELFGRQEFVDVAYFEPFYLKDFIATTPKKKVI